MKVQRPHVWIKTDPRGIARAGLLLEWRRAPSGDWEGRVVVMNGSFHHPEEVVTILWIKAEFLAPVRVDNARI